MKWILVLLSSAAALAESPNLAPQAAAWKQWSPLPELAPRSDAAGGVLRGSSLHAGCEADCLVDRHPPVEPDPVIPTEAEWRDLVLLGPRTAVNSHLV